MNNYSQALPPQPCFPDIHTAPADRVLHHPSTGLQQCKYLKQTRIGAVGPRGCELKTGVTGQLLPPFRCTDTAEKGSSVCRMLSTSPVCQPPSPITGNTYILLDYFLALFPLPYSALQVCSTFLLTTQIPDCELLYFFNCFQEQVELYLAAI